MMSYIDLINGFERVCESEALPAASQLLWYKLIYLFNRRGWPEWVQVDNMRLMSVAGIRDEKTLIRSRSKLIELGLFEYKPGKKGSPGKYKINTDCFTGIFPVNMPVNMPVNVPVNMPVNLPVETPDIYKTKTKTKTKKEYIKDIPEKDPVLTGDAELDNVFAAFIDYRAEIGKPMTDRAVHIALNKLMELSDTTQGRIAVINQSIERGWTGLFPVKEPAAKKKPGNKFGNFHQRDYDYSDMEKRMVEQRVKCSE